MAPVIVLVSNAKTYNYEKQHAGVFGYFSNPDISFPDSLHSPRIAKSYRTALDGRGSSWVHGRHVYLTEQTV